MTTDLRTDDRSPDNGRAAPPQLRPAAAAPASTDAANGRTDETDGRPNGRTDGRETDGRTKRTDGRNGRRFGRLFGRNRERTDAPNGRANGRTSVAPAAVRSSVAAPAPARSSVLPRGYGAAFLVLVATTMTAGVVSFLFSFGNVRSVAIMLGVPGWIQPLISPAVDVSVVGLIVVIQFLITAGIKPERLREANALLIAAGCAMMAANVAPSIVLGATAEQGAGHFYGRAALDATTPALLIAWAHVGPKLVRLFVEVREAALAAAQHAAVQRTIATDADRAAAAAALTDAREEAERIRTAAADELAAAASVRQQEADAAAEAERTRRQLAADLHEKLTAQERTTLAQLADRERTTAAQLADRERTAETAAARRTRDAELLAQRAASELAEARTLVEQAHRERTAAEAERTAAAEDRRAAEELLASAADERTSERPDERTDDGGGGGGGVSPLAGRQSVRLRVEAWKAAHADWADRPTPTQQELRDFFPGLSSADTITKIRQKIDEAKQAA